MKLRQIAITTGLVLSSAIALSAPAQAFNFATNYTQTLSGSRAAKGNIFLNSVKLEDGKVIQNFSLINSVGIVSNDVYTGGNSGAASADIGDLATTGVRQEALTKESAKINMNNLNLNNIIDTEDTGSFVLDFKFEQAVDRIFLWERGMNSRLDIQALNAKNEVIGSLLQLTSNRWQYAGFNIDTKEIDSAQKVGSIGISMADLGLTSEYISALRVTSKSTYNGPDFKIVGGAATVPEPSALLGLGTLAAGVLVAGRRKRAQAA